MDICVYGSVEEPLFQAKQIGRLLGLVNIRSNLCKTPSDMKIEGSVMTSKGPRDVTLLTEKAVLLLVFRSRGPNSQLLQDWVCDTIKKIRTQALHTSIQQHQLQQLEMQRLQEELDERQLEKASFLYVVKLDPRQPDSDCTMKVGMTKDCIRRHEAYKQVAPGCLLLISVEVPRDKVRKAEVFLHDMLKMRKFHTGGEVYHGSADVVKMWTTLVGDLYNTASSGNDKCLEAMVGSCNEQLRDVSEQQLQPSEMRQLRNILEEFTAKNSTPQVQSPLPVAAPSTKSITAPPHVESSLDFERFVRECCCLGPDKRCASGFVAGRYRTWARLATKDTQTQLNTYMRTHFRAIRFTQDKHDRHGFEGIDIIEFHRPRSLVPCLAERFCLEICSESSASRMYYPEMKHAFFKWRKQMDDSYQQSDLELCNLNAYLKQYYVTAALWMPEEKATQQGFYSICLKGDEDRFLRRMPSTSANPVEITDPGTGKVVRRFDKVSEAASFLGKIPCTMSHAIRNRKLCNGFYVRYAQTTLQG